jgi:hypothetical protein
MNVPVFEITRVVVFLHAGALAGGRIVPLALTDADGRDRLEEALRPHLEAGARLIYDGPPNVAPPSTTSVTK